MINIQATSFVKPIEYEREFRPNYPSDGIFDELRSISNQLKSGLDGFVAWIQIFALIQGSGPLFLESAGRELTRIADYFNAAVVRLMNYLEQIPHPKDIQIAFGIEQILTLVLVHQLPKETRCELGEYGWTSWGERISPQQTTKWTLELIQQLLSQITIPSWQRAQSLILQAKNHLQY